MGDDSGLRRHARLARVAGLATLIPAQMAIGPILGWFLGGWIGGWMGSEAVGGLAGLIVGFAAGVRVAWEMIVEVRRELAALNDDSEG